MLRETSNKSLHIKVDSRAEIRFFEKLSKVKTSL